MKISFLGLLITLLLVVGCNSNTELIDEEPVVYLLSGKILGFDLSLCACCGGYFTSIDGLDTQFRAQSVPTGFDALLAEKEFPVLINFNYTDLDSCSSNKFINIDDMEFVE